MLDVTVDIRSEHQTKNEDAASFMSSQHLSLSPQTSNIRPIMPAYSQWMFVIAFGIIPIPLVCLTLAALGYLDRPIAAFWRWYDRKTAEQRKKQAYDPKTGIGRGVRQLQRLFPWFAKLNCCSPPGARLPDKCPPDSCTAQPGHPDARGAQDTRLAGIARSEKRERMDSSGTWTVERESWG